MPAAAPAGCSAAVDNGRAAVNGCAMASAAARHYPVREQLRKDRQLEQ
jgi:hypothetical protein